MLLVEFVTRSVTIYDELLKISEMLCSMCLLHLGTIEKSDRYVSHIVWCWFMLYVHSIRDITPSPRSGGGSGCGISGLRWRDFNRYNADQCTWNIIKTHQNASKPSIWITFLHGKWKTTVTVVPDRSHTHAWMRNTISRLFVRVRKSLEELWSEAWHIANQRRLSYRQHWVCLVCRHPRRQDKSAW